MKSSHLYKLLFFLAIGLTSCSTTKYVPEGSLLLNKVEVKVPDSKIQTSLLEDYIQQKPNSNFLFIPKMRLKLYSLSGRDSARTMNRILKKIGSPPVLYDSLLTERSIEQLEQELSNLGYLNNHVWTSSKVNNKKIDLTYYILAKEQYTIKQFSVAVEDSMLRRYFQNRSYRKLLNVKSGEPFEAKRLDAILKELVLRLRNQGYYYLSDDNFYFLVDTMVGNYNVNVELKYRAILAKTANQSKDLSLTRCSINQLYCVNGYDYFDTLMRRQDRVTDTLHYKGLQIVNYGKNLIRPSILYYHNFIRPNTLYSDRSVDNTYTSLNSLGAVDRVNIRFKPLRTDSSRLNAIVTLSPSKIYYLQMGIDGTNSAGDLGVAANFSFQHKNLFGGSEVLKLKLKGAYEHVNANAAYSVEEDDYYEYGGELSLTIPRLLLLGLPERFKQQVGASTLFSFSVDWRKRPEYHRRFLSWDWKYNWTGAKQRLTQIFTLYNVNYVVTPRTSKWFQSYLDLPENIILKESYKDLFVTRTAYSFLYQRQRLSNSLNNYSLQGSAEVAGTLPALICHLLKRPKEDGAYYVMGTPFAQYFKFTLSGVRSFSLDGQNSLLFHAVIGIASPYGNSLVIPYEQRFFAGGGSSVRGWATRTLGPGRYHSDNPDDFLNRTGEIKLVLNAEYRITTNSPIELAVFLDAGNIWTIKNYPNQPGGLFQWNSFYKELAFSWGVGVRPNFKFVVLRFDAGMKLYNPAKLERKWTFSHIDFWEDFAFHFAVGYPF